MESTTDTRPIALGYVSARNHAERDRQNATLKRHARAAGLRLIRTVSDDRGGWTISQLLKTARDHDADVVLLPAAVALAEAHARLATELGGRCVVVEGAAVRPDRDAARPGARLTSELRRRTPADVHVTA